MTPGKNTPPGEATRVLVVDDDPDIRDVLAFVLTQEGYAVTRAANGEEALAVLDEASPAIILLDMKMPVMDGWAFARAYRQRPGPRAPIIVVTAATDAAARAAEIGAEGYLGKPCDLSELYETLARCLAPG